MSLISTSIPNLVNGVSQQPYALRLASQCEVQVNAYSSVIDGLRKRPPSRFRSELLGVPTGDVFTHAINRDENERYQLIIGDRSIQVFDLRTGVAKVVHTPNGLDYLHASQPSTAFRAVTVADFTFIVNRNTKVAQGTQLSPVRDPEALIWIKQGAYGTKYSIWIDDAEAAVTTTPAGTQASESAQIATDVIASTLEGQLRAKGFVVTRNGSSLLISKTTKADFKIAVTDGQGDTAMKLVKGKCQRFTELPQKGFDGVLVEIEGDQNTAFDGYYVTYKSSSGGASGTWTESMKGGEAIGFDASTMPHVLTRDANGEFTFKRADWVDRKVGDLDSVPMPSFVGAAIQDIFFHRNRLGFIADENVVFSRASDFFIFWRSSATDLLDTDPIDVAVSHVKVSLLQHAVPFNETLLLFSAQTQFRVSASELLTPKTVSISQTTEFECSLKARPVGIGRNVYFAFNRGRYSGLREYYVDADTDTNDAADITSHVPKYVPGGVTKIAASSNEDVLACLSSSSRNQLFIYKFYWSGQEKLQSSWSEWTFSNDTEILNADFFDSELWMVIRRGDKIFLESMDFSPGALLDTNDLVPFHVDRAVPETQCSVTYDDNADETTIFLPYTFPYQDGLLRVITRSGDPRQREGRLMPIVRETPGAGKVVVRGRVEKFYVGLNYVMRYRFSTFTIREEASGGGMQAVGEGRLQLRRASLTYDKSGYFRVEVTPLARDTYRYIYAGRVLGKGDNKLGVPAISSGRFGFPIMSKNDQVTIEILNDAVVPCGILSAEWEGFYTIRSKRL